MKKQTEVDRVAQQIDAMLFPDSDPVNLAHPTYRKKINAVARWHMAEVRRARGRTVGWCDISPMTLTKFDDLACADFTGTIEKRRYGCHNAKLVLVPRNRK